MRSHWPVLFQIICTSEQCSLYLFCLVYVCCKFWLCFHWKVLFVLDWCVSFWLFLVGCRSDTDCPSDKTCMRRNCINPCLVRNPCAYNAECYAQNHKAQCRCPAGYVGDPRKACELPGCRSDDQCPNPLACRNRECVDPCLLNNPCARSAQCVSKDHRANCRCPLGFFGDPYVECKPEPQPECKIDSDCPSRLACINERCQNPCPIIRPCHPSAECRVVDTVPVRTMICMCPDGHVVDRNAQCLPSKLCLPQKLKKRTKILYNKQFDHSTSLQEMFLSETWHLIRNCSAIDHFVSRLFACFLGLSFSACFPRVAYWGSSRYWKIWSFISFTSHSWLPERWRMHANNRVHWWRMQRPLQLRRERHLQGHQPQADLWMQAWIWWQP